MEQTKKTRVIEDKISIFGILGASKAVTTPLKELIELGKQTLEAQKQQAEALNKIESSLAKSSVAQTAIANALVRITFALEEQRNLMMRR